MAVSADRARDGWSARSSLEELGQLAASAGVKVVGSLIQHLPHPSARHYLGIGKLDELVSLKGEMGYDVVIFDDELTPRQQRTLEDALKVKVIDRTALILDIFARNARTREAELQVELAQHQYLLPRLAGQWSHLERLGGGIGTRGPGESQLETDRRLARRRIHRLQGAIEDVRRQRTLYRRRRQVNGVPVVALVGYTNAGKSTLCNALCRSDVLVEDRLFSTLDPITRRFNLPHGGHALLTDTVGFIQKLPPTLVAAFRATLEEMGEADLLLEVVDLNHPHAAQQVHSVQEVLRELGLDRKALVLVLNKVDLCAPGEETEEHVEMLSRQGHRVVRVSAARGLGLDTLLDVIEEEIMHRAIPEGELC
ncbi:MAG: GTPase HflX [Dehalococcoidia bacterium]